MELDKRIIEGKTYLDCFDTEVAKGFIGKECYLSDGIASFANVDNLNKAVLKEIDEAGINPYMLENTRWRYSSNFILPCEWVKEEKKEPKEPKYREYKNLDEFFDVTGLEIGDLIHLKFPGDKDAELLIVGGCDDCLFIGIHKYTFKQLFAMVEISISGEWQPFGVLEE